MRNYLLIMLISTLFLMISCVSSNNQDNGYTPPGSDSDSDSDSDGDSDSDSDGDSGPAIDPGSDLSKIAMIDSFKTQGLCCHL